MIARVASHCFWFGRYLERIESTARSLTVTRDLVLDGDFRPGQCWLPLLIVGGEEAAFVGHFGSPDRLSYTAIGNGINLASRLEGLNKLYGTTIIASEAIRQQVEGHFSFRLLDLVAVKGKEAAVRIYELLGEPGTPNPSERFVAGYEAAFQAYLARDFAGAVTLLRAQSEEDPPSGVLLARCLAYEVTPPPPDWQGVHIATEK